MERTARWAAIGLMLVLFGIQMVNVSSVMAATVDQMSVTCQYVSLSGKTETNTAYVRIQVALASNLNTIISQQVVSTHGHTRAGADYQARVDIRKAHLGEGTLLVIAVGEWDGTKYLQPASIVGEHCGIVPTHTPFPGTLTPTFGFSPTPPVSSLTPTPSATATLSG